MKIKLDIRDDSEILKGSKTGFRVVSGNVYDLLKDAASHVIDIINISVYEEDDADLTTELEYIVVGKTYKVVINTVSLDPNLVFRFELHSNNPNIIIWHLEGDDENTFRITLNENANNVENSGLFALCSDDISVEKFFGTDILVSGYLMRSNMIQNDDLVNGYYNRIIYNDGDLFCFGKTNFGTDDKSIISKFNRDLSSIVHRFLAGAEAIEIKSIKKNNNNNFIISGTYLFETNTKTFVLEMDADLGIIGTTDINFLTNENSVINDIAIDSNDNIFIVGNTSISVVEGEGTNDHDSGFIIKLSSEFNIVEKLVFNFVPLQSYFDKVAIDENDNVFIGGTIIDTDNSIEHAQLIKLNNDLDFITEKRYGAPVPIEGNFTLFDFIISENKLIVVMRVSNSVSYGNQYSHVLRTDLNLNPIDSISLKTADYGLIYFSNISINSLGNYVLAGNIINEGTATWFRIVELNKNDLSIVNKNMIYSTNYINDLMSSIYVDQNNNKVIVSLFGLSLMEIKFKNVGDEEYLNNTEDVIYIEDYLTAETEAYNMNSIGVINSEILDAELSDSEELSIQIGEPLTDDFNLYILG